MRRTFVFVGGLHRSGTSLVADCLGCHGRVSRLGGTGVPEDEGQHLQDVYPPALAFGGPGRFAFAPEAHLTEVAARASVAARRRLLRAWAPFWDLDRPVLLEKSPPNMLRTRFLQALFPEAHFAIVVRHPAAVALSTRAWQRRLSLEELVRHWLRAHAILLGDLPHLRRVVVLKYEELVASPAPALKALGEALGLDGGVPSDLIDPSRAARYRTGWSGAEAVAVARRYEQAVNGYGYSFLDLDRSEPFPQVVEGRTIRICRTRSSDGGTPISETSVL